jgi:hypothetical protein
MIFEKAPVSHVQSDEGDVKEVESEASFSAVGLFMVAMLIPRDAMRILWLVASRRE